MTHQSCSNSLDEVVPGGSSCSSSTTSREVYSLPLGHNGDVYLSQEEQNLVGICGGLAAETGAQTIVVGSPGTRVGNEVLVTVEGNANFTINHVGSSGQPLGDGAQKNGQVVNGGTTPSSQQVPKRLKHFLKDKPTQFWLAGLLLAIMSIASLVLFFSLYKYGSPTTIAPTFGHNDNLGDDIQVIHREEWLAREPLNVTKISSPLKIVRIMHTAGTNCNSYQSCAKKVLALQGWQVGTEQMPDIAYNFLIGGDGNVYVGRGPEVENQWMKNAMDIVYIGNYLGPYDKLTDKMEEAGKRLIARLRKQGFITPDYVVVPQNQTTNTQSPGDNIYKKIIKWPRYDPGMYF